MAILDEKLELCDGTQINCTTTETSILGDIINLGAADLNIGAGTPLELNILVSTRPTTAAALTLALYTYSTSVITSGSAIMTFHSLNSTMSAGTFLFRGRLPDSIDRSKYIGLVGTQSVDVDPTGVLDAWINLHTETDLKLQPSVNSC